MSEIVLSLFASAVRPHLWAELLESLKGGNYKYEVVFSGFIDKTLWEPFTIKYPEFRYIQTADIKPSQCYEVARRVCKGGLIGWIADDCRFSENFVDKIYDYFESIKQNWIKNENPQKGYFPHIISCKTNENDNNETMQNHRFFGRNLNTPLMAPLGIMVRKYLEELGGLDRRYICGQYENDIVLRALEKGSKVYLYEDVSISIDHKNKHGSETNFWSGYNEDRELLENSWCVGGFQANPEPILVIPQTVKSAPYWYIPIKNVEVTLKRNDKFVSFEDKDLLTVSQSPAGQWNSNGA